MLKKTTQQALWFWVGIAALIAVGFWLRFAHLGATNFQNDEFYHLEAAVGYLQTGHYALWDFQTHTTGQVYTRAWIYTWQVAQSFKIFGVNEFAARLPSVIWGVLTLPLLAYLAKRVTGSHLVAVLAVTMATFDQSLIWASRTCRMYSLFIFLVLLVITLVVESILRKPKYVVFHPVWFVAAVPVFILSYMAHESALALGAGVIGVLVWMTAEAFVRRTADRKIWMWLLVGTLTLVGVLVLVDLGIKSILPNQFFTLRPDPNWEYGIYLFNQMRLGFFGWPLLGVGMWAGIKYQKKGMAVLLGTVLPIIFFFVFIGDRYAAKKYILFILPFVLIAVALGLEKSIRLGIPAVVGRLPQWITTGILVLVFLGIGFVPSWPGLNLNGFQLARADENSNNAKIHDFQLAYHLIERKMSANKKTILIQGSQSFYWSRADVELVNIGLDKKFSKSDLVELYKTLPHGFVVWPKYKSYHVSYDVRSFARHHLKRLKGTKRTNMQVYQW